MTNFSELAASNIIEKTIESLKNNGIDAEVVQTAADAKKRVLDLIPNGSEVMTMTSVTHQAIGTTIELNDSGNYKPVRAVLMDKSADPKLKRQMGAAPDFATGSVHAVTEDGKLIIASQSGSQLPSYSFSAGTVVWVVGTQKIVKNIEEGMRRVEEYVLPLESERAKKAYGASGSSINKLLIINKESKPGRLHLIFVNEKLGF
jgi:hypothetical protein